MSRTREESLALRPEAALLASPSALHRLLMSADALDAAAWASDPGLCMHLLELHAGAWPAGGAGALLHLHTESDARAMLGTLALQQLAEPLGVAARERLEHCTRASVLRACLARALAKATKYSSPEEAYLLALLLDAGGLVLATRNPAAAQGGATELSLALFQRWSLPLAAQDALRYSRLPLQQLSGLHLLTVILRIADEVSRDATNTTAPTPASSLLSHQVLTDLLREAEQECAQLLPSSDTPVSGALPQALFAALCQSSNTAPEAALRSWFKDAPLLFLHHDAAQNLLRGADNDALRIPLQAGLCAAADCWLTQSVTCHRGGLLQTTPRLVDDQLSRLLGRSALVCAPWRGANSGGVWVMGADSNTLGRLQAQEPLLLALGRPAAAVTAPVTPPPVQRIREVLHEASAPLTTLGNYLHVLGMRTQGAATEELRVMREELARLNGILQQLKNTETLDNSLQADLNQLLRDVLGSATLRGAEKIRVSQQFDTQLPPLKLDGGAAKQIFINLIHNAIEAMPEGGELRVHTQDHAQFNDGERVLIEISDSGPGLDGATLAQLFKPKNGSRKPGHSGLGLSIVWRLVQQLGGHITCRSSSRGTHFQLWLPRVIQGEK